MILKLNGQAQDVPEGTTLHQLCNDLKLDRTRIVILLNGEIIPPENEEKNCVLQPDDVITCLAFAGGG